MSANEIVVNTPVATAMGAKIRLSGPVKGMYLVIGRSELPVTPVRACGGETVLALNGRKILATLPFLGYLVLKDNPRISHIGPVTIDLKRLTQVANMLAAAGNGRGGNT